MTPRPWQYPTREAWLKALIEHAEQLNAEAQALPDVPDPPTYPWE